MNFYLPFKSSGKISIPLIIISALGIGILGISQIYSIKTSKTQTVTAEARAKKNQNRPITALGRIEPQREVITIRDNFGERIVQLVVKKGQQVKAMVVE